MIKYIISKKRNGKIVMVSDKPIDIDSDRLEITEIDDSQQNIEAVFTSKYEQKVMKNGIVTLTEDSEVEKIRPLIESIKNQTNESEKIKLVSKLLKEII